MSNFNETYLEVIDYLCDTYNQYTEKYPEDGVEVYPYANNVFISYWGCGAYVVIGKMLYEIHEDDGNWFPSRAHCKYDDEGRDEFGSDDDVYDDNSCDVGWLASTVKALTELQDYMYNVVWKK